MLTQKVYKNGNSLAVTLPSSFVKKKKIKAGQEIMVRQDLEFDSVVFAPVNKAFKEKNGITPEFLDWLEKFNKKYKTALTELAKK